MTFKAMTASLTAETLVALYHCQRCDLILRAAERDGHMRGDCFAYPVPHPTLRIECETSDCCHCLYGCDFTDCIERVLESGQCPECGCDARVYTIPLTEMFGLPAN